MNAKTKRAKKTYEEINRRLRALALPFFLNTWEEEAKKAAEKLAKIPKEDYLRHQNVLLEAYPKFVEAKNSGSFAPVRPYLKEIILFNRRYAAWEETDSLKGYDILLDEYEEGMTSEKYDAFFARVREELVKHVRSDTALSKAWRVPDCAKYRSALPMGLSLGGSILQLPHNVRCAGFNPCRRCVISCIHEIQNLPQHFAHKAPGPCRQTRIPYEGE